MRIADYFPIRRWLAMLSCLTGMLVAVSDTASGQVVIELTDGKRLYLDAIGHESNSRTVALKAVRPGAELTRRLRWERIVSATLDGLTFDGPGLRTYVLKMYATAPDRSAHGPEAAAPEIAVRRTRWAPPPPIGVQESVSSESIPGPWNPSPAGCCVSAPIPPEPHLLSSAGVLIGVRQDPLRAYPDLERQYFPNGIPLMERGYARELFRAITAQDALAFPFAPGLPAFPPVVPVPNGPAIPVPLPAPERPAVPPDQPRPGQTQSRPSVDATQASYTARRSRNVARPGSIEFSPTRRNREAISALGQATRCPTAVLPASGLPVLPQELGAIFVSAVPVSANGNADWDALFVCLTARDRLGREVPVGDYGTLRATLWGQRQRLVRSFGPNVIGDPGRVERIETWTRDLESTVTMEGSARSLAMATAIEGIPLSSARFTLPLGGLLPDHDVTRFPYGQLNVELTVPGAGVFTASSGPILLKQIGPLRDQQLLQTGSPFFNGESTTGSTRFGGMRHDFDLPSGPLGGILAIDP